MSTAEKGFRALVAARKGDGSDVEEGRQGEWNLNVAMMLGVASCAEVERWEKFALEQESDR